MRRHREKEANEFANGLTNDGALAWFVVGRSGVGEHANEDRNGEKVGHGCLVLARPG